MLVVYQANDPHAELLLECAFHSLRASGDLTTAWHAGLHSMTAFLNYYHSGARLIYDTDSKGIWFMFWVEPIMAGAIIGLWIRQDKRHTKAAYKASSQAFEEALQVFPVLLALTRFENLHEEFIKAGFQYKGEIPGLIPNSEIARLYVMNKVTRANAKVVKYKLVKQFVKQAISTTPKREPQVQGELIQ